MDSENSEFVSINLSSNKMNGGKYDDKIIDDFHEIFKKAKEFKDRAHKLHGADNYGGGKKLNDTIVFYFKLRDEIKKTGKYPELKPKDRVNIAKRITDEAKKRLNKTILDESVKDEALKILKDSNKLDELVQLRLDELDKNVQKAGSNVSSDYYDVSRLQELDTMKYGESMY
jgi:hypothetical protein